MEITYSLEDVHLIRPSHVTVGAFDGVHRGHQHLIGAMTQSAHAAGRAAVAFTFDPHPGAVLGRRSVAALSTIEERAALLEELEVDLLSVLRFTPAVAGLSATHFVGLLRRYLRMVELWVGPDFALGHRREGNVAFLRRVGEQEGFAVCVVPPLQWRGGVVSSTRIRAALTGGDIEEANGCLGRPYALTGRVVRGQGLGRQFGIPTANIDPPPGRLVPANGVYACRADTEQAKGWPAVVNVGVRPTVATDGLAVEAHLLDFAGDLYGQPLRLAFIARLRDEVHFPTVDDLLAQVQKDIARARVVLGLYQTSEV